MQINPKIYIGTDPKELEKCVKSFPEIWDKDKNLDDHMVGVFTELLKSTESTPKFLFTKNIIEESSKTKITEKSIRLLIDLCNDSWPTQLMTFLLPHKFYTFTIQMNQVWFVQLNFEKGSPEKGQDPKEMYYGYGVWRLSKDRIGKMEPWVIEFFQLLTFFRIAENRTIVLNSKKKVGTRKNGYHNNTPSDFVIVDTTWNRTVIRTEGFSVKGHYRLQPFGPGNKQLKLIWIDPFNKNGYIRGAKRSDLLLKGDI